MQFRCPNCQNPIQIANSADEETFKLLSCPSCNSKISFATDATETIVPGSGMMIAHYEIRQLLGHGSYGTVYEAWDTELERKVAIKVPRHSHSSPEMNQSFLREARSAASVTHPNVVAVYELGQYNDSVYIASEFIDGIELGDYLKQQTATLNDYAAMMIKLLRAAHVFHENGVIHRDLKPGNILIDKTGEPHITDFGLARREAGHEVTVTQSGHVVGTPAFMPPEQARGEMSTITPVSDVYSMGVILYVMLTDKRPFVASDTRTLLFAIQTTDPTPPRKLNPAVSRDLETICLKAMSKFPVQRYQSAAEFADDLQRHLDGKTIVARPVSGAEKLWKRIRRSPLMFSMTGLAALLLASLIYVVFFLTPLTPEQTPQTVQISVQSATATGIDADTKVTWGLGRLDEFTRNPIKESVIIKDGDDTLEVDLAPGEYLFVVDVPGLGFHEVYRTVPIDPASDELQPIYPHQRWTYNTETSRTQLPIITVFPTAEVTAGMVRVAGADFVMGDDIDDRPKHIRQIKSFYVDRTEVSIAEFEMDGVQIIQTDFPDDFAASSISWHGAVAWAERHGKRLLTEAEFEYLATNLGTADYPSENARLYRDGKWQYGPVGQPIFDCVPALNIFGLHSNVAEWTSSTFAPYPEGNYHGSLRPKIIEQRIIRGGPSKLGENDRSQNTYSYPVRFRSSHHAADFFDDEVGFRCGVSSRPALLEN